MEIFQNTTHISWLEAMEFFLPKVFFAIVCGGIVGLEREIKGKSAGMKTNVLICLGAAIYTALSVLLSAAGGVNAAGEHHLGDPGRVAAQIVSGVGFLGAGVILQARGAIIGLTTAAIIWVMASLGIAIGMGYGWLAVTLAVCIVSILIAVTFFEDKVLRRSRHFQCDILWDQGAPEARSLIYRTMAQNDLNLEDFELAERAGMAHVQLRYRGSAPDHKRFLMELWSIPGIREVKNT